MKCSVSTCHGDCYANQTHPCSFQHWFKWIWLNRRDDGTLWKKCWAVCFLHLSMHFKCRISISKWGKSDVCVCLHENFGFYFVTSADSVGSFIYHKFIEPFVFLANLWTPVWSILSTAFKASTDYDRRKTKRFFLSVFSAHKLCFLLMS